MNNYCICCCRFFSLSLLSVLCNGISIGSESAECWWKWCFYIHFEFSALLQNNNTIIFDGPNRRNHFPVPTSTPPPPRTTTSTFSLSFSPWRWLSYLYVRFVGGMLLYHSYSCCFMHVQWPNANLCVLWLRGNHKINIFYAFFHCFFDVLFQPRLGTLVANMLLRILHRWHCKGWAIGCNTSVEITRFYFLFLSLSLIHSFHL